MFVGTLWGIVPDNNPPAGAEWWGMFVFLIPFEAIGLAMFLALLATLLEPVHWTVWRFTRHGVDRRHRWLCFGPHRAWEVLSLDRVELRRDASRKQVRFSRSGESFGTADGEGRGYRLSLVDQDNTELCSIPGLTEGEARWIGDVVLRERAGWFG